MLQPSYEAPLPREQAHLYPIGTVSPFDIYSRHASRAVCKSPGFNCVFMTQFILLTFTAVTLRVPSANHLTHDTQVGLFTSMTSVYSLAPIIFGADSLD